MTKNRNGLVVICPARREHERDHDRGYDSGPRALEPRVRPCEYPGEAAVSSHGEERPRGQVDPAEGRDEAAGGDAQVDDDREPGAGVAGGEGVERGRVRGPGLRVVDAEAD